MIDFDGKNKLSSKSKSDDNFIPLNPNKVGHFLSSVSCVQVHEFISFKRSITLVVSADVSQPPRLFQAVSDLGYETPQDHEDKVILVSPSQEASHLNEF